jgi:hypothetical protein
MTKIRTGSASVLTAILRAFIFGGGFNNKRSLSAEERGILSAAIINGLYPDVVFICWKLLCSLMLTHFLFANSYVAAILVGPGDLSWFYRERSRRLSVLLVTTDGQRAIAKAATSCRCRFFKSALRGVVRPACALAGVVCWEKEPQVVLPV